MSGPLSSWEKGSHPWRRREIKDEVPISSWFPQVAGPGAGSVAPQGQPKPPSKTVARSGAGLVSKSLQDNFDSFFTPCERFR